MLRDRSSAETRLLLASLAALAIGCGGTSQPGSDGGPEAGSSADAGPGELDAATPDGGALPDAPPLTLRNPIKLGSPDPWMFYFDGYYYVTATRGNRVSIARARSVVDLAAAPETTIWTDSTPSRCCNIWAPEIHHVGERFYLYYTADDGSIGNHRMFVAESAGNDPMGPYTFKAELATQDFFAIDGTLLTMPDGALYFVWSGVPETSPRYQNLYIAPMSDPWTLSGPPSLLASPTYPWETQGGDGTTFRVNEGPEPLYHDGRVYLAYSASGCATPDYALGLLTYTGGDPANMDSWFKSPNPVFSRADLHGVYGPGHNSFFRSPDGTETWNAYHAIHRPEGSCGGDRSLRIQRVRFSPEGVPELGTPVASTSSLVLPSGDPGGQVLPSGRYRIVARGTDLSVAAEGCESGGADVALATSSTPACATWSIEAIPGGRYRITLERDGRALSVPGCSTIDHGDVALEAPSEEGCQSWFIDPADPEHYRISAAHTGYPLDVDACDSSAGVGVNTWREYRADACQQWGIVPAP